MVLPQYHVSGVVEGFDGKSKERKAIFSGYAVPFADPHHSMAIWQFDSVHSVSFELSGWACVLKANPASKSVSSNEWSNLLQPKQFDGYDGGLY
jgi:hypothetical protein